MLLYTDNMTRRVGSFEIPFLGTCRRSLFCQLLVILSLISLPKYVISVSVCCNHQFRFFLISTIPWKNIHAKFYSRIQCYRLSGTRVKVDACFCAYCVSVFCSNQFRFSFNITFPQKRFKSVPDEFCSLIRCC